MQSIFILFFLSVSAWALDSTPTGIPLNSEWRKSAYNYAKENVIHPSWGLAHSERNFQVTKELAQKEGFTFDEDVLFAASFYHDIGGLPGYEKEGVDHAVRSAEVAEPLLQKWGFPMDKWKDVKEVILGHTYYSEAPKSQLARAFRDADILDFLGVIGVARLLAVTQEERFRDGTLRPTVGYVRSFSKNLPSKCSLKSSMEIAQAREKESTEFLRILDSQTFNGAAL